MEGRDTGQETTLWFCGLIWTNRIQDISLTLKDSFFPLISQKTNSEILIKNIFKGLISECVQFGADPKKVQMLFQKGNVQVCTLRDILVFTLTSKLFSDHSLHEAS